MILVLRPEDRFSLILRQNGFEVFNLELIRTAPLEDQSELDLALARISDYDGLFITSPAAAEVFAERAKSGSLRFSGEVFVLGSRIKKILEPLGVNITISDTANTAEELIRSFAGSKFANKNFLFIRGRRSLGTIPRLLEGIANVDEVTVYRTIELEPLVEVLELIRGRLRLGEIIWLCLFSPSGVDSLCRLFSLESVGDTPVAAIGQTTAERAAKRGLRVEFIATRPSAQEFAKSLIGHIKNSE